MEFQANSPRGRVCLNAIRVIGILLVPWLAPAQRYVFKYYAHDQGLANLAVNCMLQDRTGFLWVGTENGLYRYDGSSFSAFRTEEGLPAARILSLHETTDGTLWVGTAAGLARRIAERFQPVNSVTPGDVWSIASDKLGTLYLGTHDGLITGLWRAALHDWHFQALPASAGVATAEVHSVFADSDGSVWFGCDKSLCQLQGGHLTVLGKNAGIPPDKWDAVLTDHEGNRWVRSANRLMMRPPGARAFTPVSGLTASRSGNLYLDRKGRILAATEHGIAQLVNHRWEHIGVERGLPVESACCVLEDREGSLWIGLTGAGLARWAGRDEWENWTKFEGLAGASVRAMYRDSMGVMWIGTEAGLQQLPVEGRRTRLWTTTDGLAGTSVRAMARGPDGAAWIGCDPGGVSRLDPQTGNIRAYGARSGLDTDHVWQLFWDRGGQLWVITQGPLYRSQGTGRRMRFERQIPPVSDKTEKFYQVAEDAGGALWLASDRGLLRYKDGTWTRFTKQDGLSADAVYNLACSPDGAVWVSYNDSPAVSRLTFSSGRLHGERFDRHNGFLTNDVSFLAVDPKKRIWVGTDNGVRVFDGRSWYYFNHGDGLLWNDCVSNAFFADGDGSVWIGTSQGLSHLRPAWAENNVAPPVTISWARLGADRFELAEIPVAPYRSRLLQIGFAGLTYRNEERVGFRYRLAGMHDDWIETDQRKAEYPALEPGAYTFEVMARAQAAWSAPARFAFQIVPPWWQTWWMRGLLILAFLALFQWVLHIYLRRVIAERKRLERAVAERTRELSLEKAHVLEEKARVEEQNQKIERLLLQAQEASRLKGEFLANMSHEIRTPMNGILGMSALGLEASTPEEQRECLEVVKASAESLLTILNEILDFSKIEAGRLELDPTPFSLHELLDGATRTMRAAAERKGLEMIWQATPEIPALLAGDESRLRQVVLNLIGNAIKFTELGTVAVKARVVSDDGPLLLVEFSVRDTGLGIPADKQRLIFEAFCQGDGSTARKYGGTGLGLTISARIVKLMGGRIWVESLPGEGSTFYFTAYFGRAAATGRLAKGSVAPQACLEPGPLEILLAEDNAVNQKLAVRLLEKRGHRVATAGDGLQAVAQYDAGHFDLILMDIQMPGMDGFEATAAIRDRERGTGKHTPIVAMTAHAESGYDDKCRAAGMDGYVTKPIDPTRLFAALRQAVLEHEPSC
jgi:signal transduction histidine kinase/ligand-binding sensor domain-containing protein/CheY-like chemotaxis protein